jgi:integrase
MGSVYKRGRVWWIKYGSIRQSAKTEFKTVAERILRQREREIDEGRIPGLAFERVTFAELMEDIRADYRINGKNLRRLEICLAHLRDSFRDMRVVQITTETVKRYTAARLDAGAAHATINRELAGLRRMLNLGAKQTPPKVSRDRMPYIPMLALQNVRKGFLEYSQFLALRDALPEYLRGFVTFAYKTGCRRGEIAGLQWRNVDRNGGFVRLEADATKNGEPRTIPLDAELRCIMAEQFRARRLDCDFVFHNNGRPIGDFRHAWKRACMKAGCPGRLLHDFRRSAVRNLVRAGIPEKIVMAISGHKTRSVFDRYNITSESDLMEAALRQDTYLQEKTCGAEASDSLAQRENNL